MLVSTSGAIIRTSKMKVIWSCVLFFGMLLSFGPSFAKERRIQISASKENGRWKIAEGFEMSEVDGKVSVNVDKKVLSVKLEPREVVKDACINQERTFMSLSVLGWKASGGEKRLVIYDLRQNQSRDLKLKEDLNIGGILGLSKSGKFLGVSIWKMKEVKHPEYRELLLRSFAVIDCVRGVVVSDEIDDWRKYRSEE